jgi:hypothetical protein
VNDKNPAAAFFTIDTVILGINLKRRNMSFNTSAMALESGKKSKVSKLVLGFISMTALVLVSMVGVAGATNNGNGNGNGNGGGNGYGGNHANVDVDVDVRGDNNVINIVLRFFFG